MMDNKVFEISNFSSNDDINALVILLNAHEQVSHLKIGEKSITFNCIDFEALIHEVKEFDNKLMIKEIIDGKKQRYTYKKEKTKHYFMFKNVENEDDIITLINNLNETGSYSNIEYDHKNRLLTFETLKKNASSALSKQLAKVNPSLEMVEHKKPIRSKEVFNQKYIKTYFKIAFWFFFVAIGLISAKDESKFSIVFWLVSLFIISEPTIKSAISQIRAKQFFSEEVFILVGLIFGIVAKRYMQVFLAIVIYQLSIPLLSKVYERAFRKIDRTVQMPEKGIRLKDDVEEEVSLYEFDKGDLLVVRRGELISIPGNVVKGCSKVNTYTNNSQIELTEVNVGSHVHSGDINAGEEDLVIKTTRTYDSTRLMKLMSIAQGGVTDESKLERVTKKLARLSTPIIILIGIIVGIVLPIYDHYAFSHFVHIGAVLFLIEGTLSSEQAISIGKLAGFAEAFGNGIVVESSVALDRINAVKTIVYDRFDGIEVNEDEFALFRQLSLTADHLVIFNDGPYSLENDQYQIYNDLSTEEKLKVMDECEGPVAYIGDSLKDLQLLQKSHVGISRGGISNSNLVKHSDVVLMDQDLNKVYLTFIVAKKMKNIAIVNNLLSIAGKIAIIILAFAAHPFPLFLAVLAEKIITAIIIEYSTSIL